MNAKTMHQAYKWAMSGARAYPGVRWTVQWPGTHITHWINEQGFWRCETKSTSDRRNEQETNR